jgi:hypothetical protein
MGSGGIAQPFLTPELDGDEKPYHFTPQETALTSYYTGDWLDPSAGLDIMEKGKISTSTRNLILQLSSLLPSECNDYFPAPNCILFNIILGKGGI